MNLKEIDTELLKEELISRGFLRVFWNREDIVMRAEALEYNLTDEEIEEVAYNIEQSFDANVGVNWDVITDHIDMVKEN